MTIITYVCRFLGPGCVLCCALLAQGCLSSISNPISSSSFSSMTPVYYPECHQPFTDLQASQEALEKSILTGVLVGAGTGAMAAALATGDPRAALVGAAVGAAAGGGVGFGVGKMQQSNADAERFKTYQAEMNDEMINASRVEQYALASLQCYTREFNKLLKDYKANKISREDLQLRYKEILAGIDEVARLTDKAQAALIKNDEEYRKVFAEQAQAANKKIPEIPPITLKTPETAAVKTPARKRGNTLAAMERNLTKRQKEATARTKSIEKRKDAQKEAAASASPAKMKKAGITTDVVTTTQYYSKNFPTTVKAVNEAQNASMSVRELMVSEAAKVGLDAV